MKAGGEGGAIGGGSVRDFGLRIADCGLIFGAWGVAADKCLTLRKEVFEKLRMDGAAVR